MRIVPPTWRCPRPCPVCGQGSALTFRSCPRCALVLVICEEEGSVFLDPRQFASVAAGVGWASACPGCGEVSIGEFEDASDRQLRALDLGPGDYE